ncbi:uncharacterized protein LOC133823677 [Humulus lupulus]|uniref:uncharacterized protein LOC133823677 n=1 Tax=Humulus lupulus TaxID=3486 RepID=UPI002B4067CB|nr:uncharacterized protein LOC133823677 [Humulus lupulus]
MARVTLINSVLLSIHSYWSQIMIMPKQLLRDIEAICRAFLWKGLAKTQGSGLVAWSSVCTPKAAGGLGFRKISEWNIASLGKYVWAIASKKDNLWVKWIHSIYLKKVDWWEYTVQQNYSWYWKKIVAIKELFKVKLDKSAFMAMQYSIQSGYDILYDQHINVQWSKFVWERSSIPKHRFILWLVMLQKLSTRTYINRYLPSLDTVCLLCGDHNEDLPHLFFQCTYSKACLLRVKDWIGCRAQTEHYHQLLQWIYKAKHLSKVRKGFFIVVVTALVYHIWRARNDVLWSSKLWHIIHIVEVIKRELKLRLDLSMPRKTRNSDKEWFQQL